jgi:hypothetical protein
MPDAVIGRTAVLVQGKTKVASRHAVSATRAATRTVQPLASSLPSPFPIAFVVRCASDLETLRKIRSARRLHVLLRISGLPLETSKAWQTNLNSALKECGCSLGARFGLAGFAASLLWQTVFSLWSVSHWPAFLLRTVTVVFLAGAFGKIAGKIRARAQIRAIAQNIRAFERTGSPGG